MGQDLKGGEKENPPFANAAHVKRKREKKEISVRGRKLGGRVQNVRGK